MKDESKCFFCGVGGVCGILEKTMCNGDHIHCSFYKTEKQYTEERNRAILLNRKKGYCKSCKYVAIKCELVKVKNDEI